MNENISAILYDECTIQRKISELGEQLSVDYEDKKPVMISVLKGSVVFLADLIRACTINMTVDFISLSSYGNKTESSGSVSLEKVFNTDLSDRHVIIVEDIIDTGLSLSYLLKYLDRFKPASIALCVLLDKVDARKIEVKIDYKGFEIENEFVVGYGLDYAERFRNLPYIGILKEEVYK